MRKLEADLQARDEKLAVLLADKNALDAELRQLRAEVAEAKRAAEQQADTHDYSEAATRDYFIDLLLKESGWPLADTRDREFEVAGMPNNQGKGFVDYVLWGDDGKPLAVVEAKRTRRDSREGRQQAKLYADCLERQFGQRPLIFYTNGYEHWYWDDAHYLTQHGAMDAALLYESPFTDFNPLGVEGVFDEKATADLIGILKRRKGRRPRSVAWLATIPCFTCVPSVCR